MPGKSSPSNLCPTCLEPSLTGAHTPTSHGTSPREGSHLGATKRIPSTSPKAPHGKSEVRDALSQTSLGEECLPVKHLLLWEAPSLTAW